MFSGKGAGLTSPETLDPKPLMLHGPEDFVPQAQRRFHYGFQRLLVHPGKSKSAKRAQNFTADLLYKPE